MQLGFSNLEKSLLNRQISMYHILAATSAYHCSAAHYESTDWKSILELYNQLVILNNSPVVLLNRAIAMSKVLGPEKALAEIELLKNATVLKNYYLFYSTEAELYIELHLFRNAISSLETAIKLAPLEKEKELLEQRLFFCNKKII
jgi:RNA polymerase sigma-70 factor (ECF subfamily)